MIQMMTKNSKSFKFTLLLLLAIGLFTACEPDPVDIENPSISLSSEPGYIYQDTTMQKGEVFKVKVTAMPGTYDLKLLAINENDTKLALDRIVSGLNANPSLTLDTDAQGFTKEIEIMAQTDGNSKYTIYVEDNEGYTEGVEFLVSDVYTGIDGEFDSLVVYNIDGPLNGSIDLHAPAIVPKADPTGDIQDEGINLNLPLESNWLQQIRPKNGAELFRPAEGLTFEGVTSKEALKAAVEAGTQVLRSTALEPGDVYLAKTASLQGTTFDYFILLVNEVVVVKDSNLDYYVFSLKQALNM
jgi:hypothetical protein